MSRRLIIGILLILIVGIVGGTAVLIVNRFRTSSEETLSQPGGPIGALPGGQEVIDPTGDDDDDGLNNADEKLWGTDPNNPDTDGDRFLDGEEVAAGHNPTIPAPNDRLPEGFVPGREIAPINPAGSAPVEVGQFFADNLDLSGGSQNLTQEYQRQYPEEERTADTLAAFTADQLIVTQLPTPSENAISLLAQDGPLVLGEYLDVAGNLAVFSNRTLLAEATNNLFNNGDSSGMRSLALTVRLHQENLVALRVPPSAEPLHRLLLGYTELLAATFNQIALYNDDPVKAVVGMSQLEEIDKKYYPLIEQEVSRLQILRAELAG